jgi:hypothetical protein
VPLEVIFEYISTAIS